MSTKSDLDMPAKLEFCMQKIVELEQRIRLLEAERYPPMRFPPVRFDPVGPMGLDPRKLRE